MRAAGRHTVPPLILKRVRRPPPDPDSTSQTRQPPSTMRPASLCRPGNRRPPCDQPHLAAPAIAACHADQPTLQTRQSPPAMRTSPPCRPGNRRPPCDQPHLADPATAVRHATSPPCRPGNRRPPCDQPHLAAPAIAACHADQPTLQTRQPPPARHAALPPYRPNRCRTTQAVPRKTDGCSTFTALPPPPPQPKGIEGHPEGPAVGRGRGGKGLRKGGVQSEGPQPYPAWACGESGGVFSRALYHLQA